MTDSNTRKRIKDAGQVFLAIRAGGIDYRAFREWLVEYRQQPVPAPAKSAADSEEQLERDRAHGRWLMAGSPTPVQDVVHHKGGGHHYVRGDIAPVRTTDNSIITGD